MDAEVVAWDKAEHKILPFQVLSTRKRKDVTEESIKVVVCLFAFDLIYYNGQSLLERPFRERRDLLLKGFQPTEGSFQFARHSDLQTTEEIQEFLEEAINSGCEGLMVKTLEAESTYEPSRRSRKWLKVKKDYLEGVGDSLDLVVIGAYSGRGKRKGVYGGFLLACWDADSEHYQAICKIGTGFTEADLDFHHQHLQSLALDHPKPYYQVHDQIKPDVWFEPSMVWEVKAADLSLSPIYQAAHDGNRGISLRFPRYLRWRQDKAPEQATTARQVLQMYRAQQSTSQQPQDNDEDFY